MKPTERQTLIILIQANKHALEQEVTALIQKYTLKLECISIIESYNYTAN